MPGVPRCGVDLVKVPRLQQAIEKYGDSFINKIFTAGEIEYCESHKRRKFEHYAGRFAAKEAFYKAISPSDARIRFRNIEIKHLPNGAPQFFISPEERERIGLAENTAISVSLSHDTDYAVAVVVIS